MIRRTLLEWSSLPYGDGEECIPEWAADRIAAVAQASDLGGEDGARILSHGRKALRAAQVVGVIAAEGCSLEILPKIDFIDGVDKSEAVGQTRRQLVHMLAIALDLKIASGDVTALGWQRENLLEILIGLFVRKLGDEVRRGMPRRYVEHEDDLTVLRGRLDVTRQFTTFAIRSDRLACIFDALSPDIALNRIMKAAVARLAGISRSNENQRRLRELALAYADIETIPPAALTWERVVLDRTNARWRELVNLARLLLGDRFQTTTSGGGRGFSLLFEMNTLFEEYIARMLKRALAGTELTVLAQSGWRYCLEDMESKKKRFQTRPDIIVRQHDSVELIVDTKWKSLNPKIEDPKQGVSQSDVYQMMAYGRLYHCPRLLLLYPHHARLPGSGGLSAQHRISSSEDRLAMATIDVSTNRRVEARLQALVREVLSLNASDPTNTIAVGA